MPIRLSQTTVQKGFRQADLLTVLMLGCMSSIINCLLLQAKQADSTGHAISPNLQGSQRFVRRHTGVHKEHT